MVRLLEVAHMMPDTLIGLAVMIVDFLARLVGA